MELTTQTKHVELTVLPEFKDQYIGAMLDAYEDTCYMNDGPYITYDFSDELDLGNTNRLDQIWSVLCESVRAEFNLDHIEDSDSVLMFWEENVIELQDEMLDDLQNVYDSFRLFQIVVNWNAESFNDMRFVEYQNRPTKEVW